MFLALSFFTLGMLFSIHGLGTPGFLFDEPYASLGALALDGDARRRLLRRRSASSPCPGSATARRSACRSSIFGVYCRAHRLLLRDEPASPGLAGRLPHRGRMVPAHADRHHVDPALLRGLALLPVLPVRAAARPARCRRRPRRSWPRRRSRWTSASSGRTRGGCTTASSWSPSAPCFSAGSGKWSRAKDGRAIAEGLAMRDALAR